ncbi:molecular chaperone TorD family protein [Vibrio crassostreae]|uniref:molecular chaperone TorD family protein n=1 Tax=Vibrio crassostreae TaxID=246167 RepID=UPI000F4AC594|nr:molecular chaperone TorD family protein [Vibrio crassostreae]NOH73833.1 molecular chaperone [Vibrio crassostreae]NOI51849.1 molecular chaperone [Vibrio crassostreae]ROR16647.1 TorA maturation chaperone TorD [Vibrio crassostreae]TCV31889.1 TorA maturation chaperone TorD [Vibrio crassostreae]CAK2034318.1 putative dimethyl sulfoxide reductase chaperone [Vibrio crassostreae]
MIIDTHKLLGSLFYQATNKEQLLDIVQALVKSEVLSEGCLLALQNEQEDALSAEFSRLFEGVGDMPAPPWGSVYLDKDRVVFGASTVEYRKFLELNQIELDTGLREPEDQFGLMLFAHAYLLENNNINSASELLECHLLPWSSVYLDKLNTASDLSFYKQLSSDVIDWFKYLTSEYNLNVATKKLYID